MVVMQHIETGGNPLNLFAWLLENSWDEKKPAFAANARCALQLLHGKGFVHGDFRPNNLIGIIEDQTPKLYVIDFDWSGMDGVAMYPIRLNYGIHWHSDVRSMAVIKKEHDAFFFKSTFDEDL